MTDADLIYNALLRAERRLEAMPPAVPGDIVGQARLCGAFDAIRLIREEIGNGLSREGR